MPRPESVRALRTLLLPISANTEIEARCAKSLEDYLLKSGILLEDFSDWANINLEQWAESQPPPAELKNAIEKVLAVAGEENTERLSRSYFSIYGKLRDEHFFGHAEARWFLSHALIILELTSKGRLTAAQVSRMLAVRDARTRFNRHTVDTFLEQMGLAPSLSLEQMTRLFEADSSAEAPYFSDATLAEAAYMVDMSARSLGYAGDLATSLQTLANDGSLSRYVPYLQILHFQCSLAEYFDHAVTDLYEFAPRGNVARWLFDSYPDVLASAANPFLNNAKSVERADIGWVRMKKRAERPGTAALESILSNLEMMGFAAKRELSRLIRLWLHRVLRAAKDTVSPLPEAFTAEQWLKVLGLVRARNSATYGILEQRLIDAICSEKYGAGWRSRGIGASVNATNVSSRRLGDCDFQSSDEKRIHAYESHGGVLTDIYVIEHIRTLKKSLILRKEELEGISDVAEWHVDLIFIAHSIQLQQFAEGNSFQADGISVSLSFRTFDQIISDWLNTNPNYSSLDQYVMRPLQQKQTPIEV